jgi:hypothetical protein
MSIPSDATGLEKWIFEEPDAKGNTSRWGWTDDWLLGDMRTFLLGAQEAVSDPTRKAFGGRLGGGNFSIPVLLTMALELLGRLHEGDTSHPGKKGYVAAYNVSKITHHFHGFAGQFCSLLWELTRNGLHHAFRPHRMYLQGIQNSTLGYVFTCHPQHPSVLVRVAEDDYYIVLNAADAVDALQSSVQDYAKELRCDFAAKQRFAAAFDALESGNYAVRTDAVEKAEGSRKCRHKDIAANTATSAVRRTNIGRGMGMFSAAEYAMKKGGSIAVSFGGESLELERDDERALGVDLLPVTAGLTATGAAVSMSQTSTVLLSQQGEGAGGEK